EGLEVRDRDGRGWVVVHDGQDGGGRGADGRPAGRVRQRQVDRLVRLVHVVRGGGDGERLRDLAGRKRQGRGRGRVVGGGRRPVRGRVVHVDGLAAGRRQGDGERGGRRPDVAFRHGRVGHGQARGLGHGAGDVQPAVGHGRPARVEGLDRVGPGQEPAA